MPKTSVKNSYRRLDSNKTVQTIELLNRRISNWFPASGLSSVGTELCQVAMENLTTGLSRKIWQKIMILSKLEHNAVD